MHDQHAVLRPCLPSPERIHEENGLHPGDGGQWEDAHYPRPKGLGDTTTPLMWVHHQVQGLLQSEEEGRRCFFIGHAKRFLLTTPFIPGYFHLWDIYDKYARGPCSESKRSTRKLSGFYLTDETATKLRRHVFLRQEAGEKVDASDVVESLLIKLFAGCP